MVEVMIIAWMAWFFTTDVIYAARGQMPPRKRVRLAEIKAGTVQQRYGVRGWWADLVDDALQAETRRRRDKAADRAVRRKAERKAAKAQRAVDTGRPDAAAVPAGHGPDPDPATGPRRAGGRGRAAGPAADGQAPVPAGRRTATLPYPWQDPDFDEDRLAAHLAGRPCSRASCSCHYDPANPISHRTTDTAPAPGSAPGSTTGPVPATAMPAPPAGGTGPAPPIETAGPGPAGTTGKEATPATSTTGEHGPLAPVIPMFPDGTAAGAADTDNTVKESDMSQPVAEVTGLQSAIAYAEGVAQAHTAHGTAEGFAASLAEAHYGPGVLDAVAAAQEASANAGAAWEQATAKLREALTVKEAYDLAPDAGDKAHVTSE